MDEEKRPARGRPPAAAGAESLRASPTQSLGVGDTPTVELRPTAGGDSLQLGGVYRERFTIRELIGHGGFSDVYRAEDSAEKRQVALKFLSRRSTGGMALGRMRRELRLARDLRHPNIVRVFELIEVGDECCLVMEFVTGRTLKETVVESGAMSTDSALRVLRGLSSAMAAVHAAGIVHRDLKPQNVMVSEEGEIKLLDFGLARTPDSTGLTATGTILGTPDYMSPEQVDGRPTDARSDVYSLGVIAWELLVGRPPFSGDKAISVAIQHLNSRVPDLRRERPGVAPALAKLVREMTDPDPGRRPSSAQAVLMQLERMTGADGSSQSLLAAHRRPSRPLLITALTMAVVAAAGVVSWRGLGMPSATAQLAAPWADGEIGVAVVPRIENRGTAGAMFLEALAGAAQSQLDEQLFTVLEADDSELEDPEHLHHRGVEHLLELQLSSRQGEAGRIYQIEAAVIDTRDGSVWRTLPPNELAVLDFEAVQSVSRRLSDDYESPIREIMSRSGASQS